MKKNNIIVLWPTARPHEFHKGILIWTERADESFIVKVAVDYEEYVKQVEPYEAIICSNPRKGVTAPLYALTKDLKADNEDIIVVASDDFVPPNRWDNYLRERFIDHGGALLVNDGHCKNIVSIPIMTYWCLLKLNRIIYNPAYNHMFSDLELYDILTEMNQIKDCRAEPQRFMHEHHIYGQRKKDDINVFLESGMNENRTLYFSRELLPLEQKLKVPRNNFQQVKP